MKVTVPGSGVYHLETIVLDLNGTLTVRGRLVPGVKQRLKKLKSKGFRLVLFSGDTRGNGAALAKSLGLEFVKAGTALEKLKEIKKLHPETCVAIGNGFIDHLIMKDVRLGIVVLQAEGVHTRTLATADVVMPKITDALDLLLDVETFIATLRV